MIIAATDLSIYSFLFIVAFILIAIPFGINVIEREKTKFIITFLILWVAVFSGLVGSGLPRQYMIPLVPLMFVTIMAGGVIFGLSPFGRILKELPLWVLVLFQGFRLPLELVLHSWVESDTIPATMTWTGQNLDIITGVLALGAAIPALRNRQFAWVFNVVGIALLLNVLRVVIMSSPFPFSWQLDNPLKLIFYMPYALIAFVCVWAAVAGHVVLTRALITGQKP